jgi:hypothetical protein
MCQLTSLKRCRQRQPPLLLLLLLLVLVQLILQVVPLSHELRQLAPECILPCIQLLQPPQLHLIPLDQLHSLLPLNLHDLLVQL